MTTCQLVFYLFLIKPIPLVSTKHTRVEKGRVALHCSRLYEIIGLRAFLLDLPHPWLRVL